MIDRIKIASQLSDQMPTLHKKKAESLQRLLVSWTSFCSDLKFQSELTGKQFLCALPLHFPEVGFATVYQKDVADVPYEVLGVDGSQIYPDRHYGFDCFLINIGALFVSYGVHASSAQFFNDPTVFKTSVLQDENTAKAVDCLRHEYEFLKALELCQNFKRTENGCIFFDGSLLFWHLQPYKNLKERFLKRYFELLLQLDHRHFLHAFYISAPQSKDLIAIMRSYGQTNNQAVDYEDLVDADFLREWLPVGARTVVFQLPINGTQDYPSVLVPCFFYLNIGHEIVRVEIPCWIASDEYLVAKIASIIWDQIDKGRGYPLVLAEAHEQAVVKNEDRIFFYETMNQYSKDAHSGTSQKQRHKQQMFY